VSLVRDTESRPLYFIAYVQDISERKREEELRLREEQTRGLADAAFEGLAVISDRGMILEVNQALLDILEHTPSEMIGRSVLEFVAPAYRDQVRQNILSNFEEPYETVGLSKDGTRLDLEVRGKAFSYQGQRVRVTAVRDITERKALEQHLRHQALHDFLTGLPNRALFTDRLCRALARAGRRRRRVAVMFVDLDNFKLVNDTFGHHAGDELLVMVSDRLRTCLRLGDTLVRLGGDEFAVLLEDLTDEGEATRIARRIIEELRVPFTLDNQEAFVTPSIGIALNDSSQDSPDGLLRNADVAMYRAKKEGKARHQLFEPGIETQSVERMRLLD
jgi:diguanylate cyclase (GGDEF)-like protein/PAS domain S-box-containing protein